MMRITDTVKHLLIINVVMFVGTISIGNGELFYQWFALYFPKMNYSNLGKSLRICLCMEPNTYFV